MKKVYEIINELENTNSRKEKERILLENKENELLKKVFEYALDKMIVFGMKEKSFPRDLVYNDNNNEDKDLENAINIVYDNLVKKNIRGHAAMNIVKRVISNLSKNNAEILKRIILKDMKCGVQTKTIKKIFGSDLEFPVLLCESYSKKNVENIKFPAIVQEKLDGVRCTIKVNNGEYIAHTRNGKMLDFGDSVLAKSLKTIKYSKPIWIDGELMVYSSNMFENSFAPRKEASGIINKVQKGTASKEEKNRLVFIIFDLIYDEDFINRYSSIPYIIRFDTAKRIVGDRKNILYAETHIAKSLDDVRQYFNKIVARGGEGVILKNKDAPWEAKRSKNYVKFKVEQDVDLKIIGFEEGSGRFKGTLGALICESADGGLRVSVGTGLTDNDRKVIWNNKEGNLGKIVTIVANDYIVNKNNNKLSLFLPRYVCFRDDKTEADTTEQIIKIFDGVYGR